MLRPVNAGCAQGISMRFRRLTLSLFASISLLAGSGAVSRAQGLIWQLPPEGEMVHYEGTYKQTTFRPAAPGGKGAGNEIATWDCSLDLKSLGSEMAEFEGQMQPCRWLEIKVINGKTAEGLDAGPVGTRIYKVLVPESRVIDKQIDGDNIPVSFLPIVKGYRKFGNKEPMPITSGVLQIYPVISMLMPYRRLAQQGEPTDLKIRLGEESSAQEKTVKATVLKGYANMERQTTRSQNQAMIWRSPDVPFGLAKWEVTLNTWAKQPNDGKTEFRPTTRIEVEMHAVYQKSNAQPDPAIQ
jgi:hypothetical protein